MRRRKDGGLLELLVRLPWWGSVMASASCYLFLVHLAPTLLSGKNVVFTGILAALSQQATLLALIFLIPAPFSYFRQWRKSQLLDGQKNAESIRALNWREFEELLAEAYRRRGYRVVENSGLGPDGGVDIRLYKEGQAYLVQCKHWKSQKVGVSVVREMLGLITAEGADRGLVITSGSFTGEAMKFAQSQPLDLVDGTELYKLIVSAQCSSQEPRLHSISTEKETELLEQSCPSCGSQLVVRLARRGTQAGNSFYGCSSFPKCRYTKAA